MKVDGVKFRHTTDLSLTLIQSKLWTAVSVFNKLSNEFEGVAAVVDTGCTFVHMPRTTYLRLGYKEIGGIPVKIYGINGESKGMSYLVDNFKLGDLELGQTRVVVSDLTGSFKDAIILGMNILMWFHTLINYTDETIKLVERRPKPIPGWSPKERFTMYDIKHKVFNELIVTDESSDDIYKDVEMSVTNTINEFDSPELFDGKSFEKEFLVSRDGEEYTVFLQVKRV